MRDLVGVAKRLVAAEADPSQACLKRAVSTVYYALFHHLAAECADLFIGGGEARKTEQWRLVFRALEHNQAKAGCEAISAKPGKGGKIRKPPKAGHSGSQHNAFQGEEIAPEVEAFAIRFVSLQEARHLADYDPHVIFQQHDVETYIQSAEIVMADLRNASEHDRRQLAVCVMFKKRPAPLGGPLQAQQQA